MKKYAMLPVLAVLLFAGCEYASPLTKEHSIAIDSAVLGLWELKSDDGEKSKPDERMLILKYSDTEYLIQYTTGRDGLYYRGYPIKLGDRLCVQLQVIGTGDGPPGQDIKDLFHVVSYQLTKDSVEVKILNTDLIDDDLKTTDELRKAFLKHKDAKELFTNPAVFKRVEK